MSDNTPYDPSAPEGQSGHNAYISKKDFKVLGMVLAGLAVVLMPIYLYGVRQSEKARCTQNIGAIYKSLEMYAIEHDDRLPPVYRTTGGDPTPGLGTTGLPFTFASDIAGYMTHRATFACPSAKEGENVPTENPWPSLHSAATTGLSEEARKDVIQTSYGMYAPFGTYQRSIIPNPDEVVIVAETSNGGSQGSFNPHPYAPYDGFVIGWDTGNEDGEGAKAVTRLAFRDTADGAFTEAKPARHDSGIHALTASGQKLVLKGPQALVRLQRGTNLPIGAWEVPP